MKIKLIASLALFFSVIAPSLASALDIPLLTWERGRVQEVVIGGATVNNNWTVSMIGNGITPIIFSASNKNTAGYIVYSAEISNTTPTGGYTIVTSGNGTPASTVAGVNLVAATPASSSPTNRPRTLSLIITMVVFLTATISALRARKYSFLSFQSTQQLHDAEYSSENIAKGHTKVGISAMPYNLRVIAVTGLRQSLFRYLMLRNGELTHRISSSLYAFMPFAGLIAAFITAVEVNKAGSIDKTSLIIFTAVAILGVCDAFAGIVATATFWLIELATGHVTSFRDAMIFVALGFAWVAPGLFANIFRDITPRDIKNPGAAKAAGYGISGFVAALIFGFGQLLINSIIDNSAARPVTIQICAIVGIAAIMRIIVEDLLLAQPAPALAQSESINIARVSSPQTAFLLFAIYFAFAYIWTHDSAGAFSRSLVFAAIFALPYFLLFIRLGSVKLPALAKAPRFIFLESLVTSAITLVIFRQISSMPLLVDRRAQIFLLLAGIPGVVHAIYSAMCDSAERQGIMQP